MTAAKRTSIQMAENNRNSAVNLRTISIATTVLGFAGHVIQPSSITAYVFVGGLLASLTTSIIAYMAESALNEARNLTFQPY